MSRAIALEWPPRVEHHTFLPAYLPANPVVLDLGVNQGAFAKQLIRRYGATVYGAEAVRDLFCALPRLEQLRVANVAINGHDQDVDIRLSPGRCASLIAATDRIHEQHGNRAEVARVRGVSFETFMRDMELNRADLAKVDIEGAEIEVFMAASPAAIRSINQYTIEFHDFLFPHLKPGVQATMRKLMACGYVRLKFSVDNTDVVFIKRELLSRVDELWLRGPVRLVQGAQRRLNKHLPWRPAA